MDDRLMLTVNIVGNASSLFEGGLDLNDELVYALDSVEDWTDLNEDITDEQSAILDKATSENIVKYSKYDKNNLTVCGSDSEEEDLVIYFHIPIYLDLDALKNTIPQEK